VRWIGCFLVFLLGVGWLTSQLRLSEPPTDAKPRLGCWRRTQDGWEQATWLSPEIPSRRPALHPGVVGTLELLVAVYALVAAPAQAGCLPTAAGGSQNESSQPSRHTA
jgi:hypothetical protein